MKRVQVLGEPDQETGNQSWMQVQNGGPLNKPVVLFDYSISEVAIGGVVPDQDYQGQCLILHSMLVRSAPSCGGTARLVFHRPQILAIKNVKTSIDAVNYFQRLASVSHLSILRNKIR